MLGGDNMDLALAHLVKRRLAPDGARLSAGRLSQLVERSRAAKEQLLGAAAPASTAITLLGADTKLIGGARSAEVTREEIERIIVEGFFPLVSAKERPTRTRGDIVEFGLPYASDPAITRHVAAFLGAHAGPSQDALDTQNPAGPIIPDTLLLNGGVFRAEPLARRIAETLGAWRGAPVHVLANGNPDVAVARGAVAYALAHAGHAPRIGGGSARSYFLLLDDGQPDGDARGVCLLPRGTEETQAIHLADRTFALRLGAPVRFHLVSTVADHAYAPGEIADVSAAAGEFVRLPPIATVVDPRGQTKAHAAGKPSEIAVQLTTSLTEVGTLEMHCIAVDDPSKRWLLKFQLRQEEPASDTAPGEMHPALPKAIDLIDRTFGARSHDVGPKEVKRLRAQLEQALGSHDTWNIGLLRELFGTLWDHAKRRRRSADHERLWLNLTGYCVRPGFGHPLDEWRVEQLWTLFDQGIQYNNESQIWSEWWTLWRRAADGLDEAAQLRLLDDMAFVLQPHGTSRYRRAAGAARAGYEDMVRLTASLERVPVARKIEVGEWLLTRLKKPSENLQSWWAVGRIGARQPFYGSAHGVVPPEIASAWLDTILVLDWKKVEPAAFAAVQIARMTSDRSVDIADATRAAVIDRLTSTGAAHGWIAMVGEVVALDRTDEGRVFGEALPAGLKLIG
ncbi:DnaK-related protein [Candidatus Paraburkholderia calva]|nr:DnaK-related protein [Candidatus Paraburkholderia calva]